MTRCVDASAGMASWWAAEFLAAAAAGGFWGITLVLTLTPFDGNEWLAAGVIVAGAGLSWSIWLSNGTVDAVAALGSALLGECAGVLPPPSASGRGSHASACAATHPVLPRRLPHPLCKRSAAGEVWSGLDRVFRMERQAASQPATPPSPPLDHQQP